MLGRVRRTGYVLKRILLAEFRKSRAYQRVCVCLCVLVCVSVEVCEPQSEGTFSFHVVM